MTFTEYMNEAKKYRIEAKKIENTTLRIGVLNALDKMDNKALNDEDFRHSCFLWLSKKESTILLRKIMKLLGYDYWGSLDDQWIVDRLDSR